MAIVPDAARPSYNEWGHYKVPPYTSGNDHPDTPNPTWQNGWAWLICGSEVHINFAYEAPTDNTADDWDPKSVQVHTLDTVTRDTWRPAA